MVVGWAVPIVGAEGIGREISGGRVVFRDCHCVRGLYEFGLREGAEGFSSIRLMDGGLRWGEGQDRLYIWGDMGSGQFCRLDHEGACEKLGGDYSGA